MELIYRFDRHSDRHCLKKNSLMISLPALSRSLSHYWITIAAVICLDSLLIPSIFETKTSPYVEMSAYRSASDHQRKWPQAHCTSKTNHQITSCFSDFHHPIFDLSFIHHCSFDLVEMIEYQIWRGQAPGSSLPLPAIARLACVS